MNEQDDLTQKRAAIIEQIKRVFPKNPPGKGNKGIKVTSRRSEYEQKALLELFDGKKWEEMASYPGIIYTLSGIDYVGFMDNKAYLYYLPAFLVSALNEPFSWENVNPPLEKIYWLMPKFSLDQVNTLITFFEYQIAIRQNDEMDYFWGFIPKFETMILHLMFRRDELVKEKTK
jgi:hypothetical protein